MQTCPVLWPRVRNANRPRGGSWPGPLAGTRGALQPRWTARSWRPTSRGATTYAEFQRQLPKVTAAILNLAPDIMGLTEIENDRIANGDPDSYGPTSAIAQLVDEVRALPPPVRKRVEERMRAYVDLVRETLVELRSAGRLRDVDPTVATFSVIGTILWLPRWFRQNGRLSQEQVANQIADIALVGLLRSRPAVKRHAARRVVKLATMSETEA